MVLFRGSPAVSALLEAECGIHGYPAGNPIKLLVISFVYSMIPSYREEEHKCFVSEWSVRTMRKRRNHQISSKMSEIAHQDREEEKNSSEFFEKTRGARPGFPFRITVSPGSVNFFHTHYYRVQKFSRLNRHRLFKRKGSENY
jgi:hypothetical protein